MQSGERHPHRCNSVRLVDYTTQSEPNASYPQNSLARTCPQNADFQVSHRTNNLELLTRVQCAFQSANDSDLIRIAKYSQRSWHSDSGSVRV